MRQPKLSSDTSVPPRRFHRAFTLIELLVVIAIIAILAALLLPTLSRAKAAGQSAACKSNLHQIGIALTLYISDYEKYPLWLASDRPGVVSASALWDFKLLPFASTTRNLFTCPADLLARKWTNNATLLLQNPSYGYNMAGTGRYFATFPSLGLDGNANGRAAGPYVAENQVKAPSDMVAVADAKPASVGSDLDLDDIHFINLLGELAPRHNNGANVVFCDAHVEYGKQTAWLQKTERARQRWNNDHRPHPETWQNNN
ncbi:MAG: hypothetical protein DME26_05515 [Verrucomicrobia bacterium]|nr:MAG: hypothetical protein DME26_05515 [Verrucomicrobiota bacterium]